MGLFDSKGLGDKLGAAKKKIGETISNAKLDEKFDKAKESVGKSMANVKQYSDDVKESKQPLEGALIRYQVVWKGGFDKAPEKKSYATSLGLNIMEDSFIFKAEKPASTQWFGEELFVIPYNKVIKLEIVKRQVESIWTGSDRRDLEVDNNINITYKDDNDNMKMVRVEMLTGTTIYKQAVKCREMMDLLVEHQILGKFAGEEKAGNQTGGDDILAQLEKLAKLKDSGVLTEEEYNAKKADLLERL